MPRGPWRGIRHAVWAGPPSRSLTGERAGRPTRGAGTGSRVRRSRRDARPSGSGRVPCFFPLVALRVGRTQAARWVIA